MEVIDFESRVRELKWSSQLEILDASVMKDYEDKVNKYGSSSRRALNSYFNKSYFLGGGNCISQPLLERCLPSGTRLARMSDFRGHIGNNPLLEKYEANVGLVLRSPCESWVGNQVITDSIVEGITEKGFSLKKPLIVYFDALDVIEDLKSPCRLNYRLRDDAELGVNIFEAPELSHENEGRKFSDISERGVPIFDEDGDKTLRTRSMGISRYFIRGGNIYSSMQDLLVFSGRERTFVVPCNEPREGGKVYNIDDYR